MNDQLTFNDLQAYQSGKLSGPARYRVERILLENPFYADALAGLEAMQQAATDTSRPTNEQLADLRHTLHERIHASANRKRLWPLWIATTTAAILFMLAMAIYFIFFAPTRPTKSKPQPTHSTTSIAPGYLKNDPSTALTDQNWAYFQLIFWGSFQETNVYSSQTIKHLQNVQR